MHDYFGEFLINPVRAPIARRGLGNTNPSIFKTHLVWALVAGSGILLSWKASEKYSEYKMAATKKKKSKKS